MWHNKIYVCCQQDLDNNAYDHHSNTEPNGMCCLVPQRITCSVVTYTRKCVTVPVTKERAWSGQILIDIRNSFLANEIKRLASMCKEEQLPAWKTTIFMIYALVIRANRTNSKISNKQNEYYKAQYLHMRNQRAYHESKTMRTHENQPDDEEIKSKSGVLKVNKTWESATYSQNQWLDTWQC